MRSLQTRVPQFFCLSIFHFNRKLYPCNLATKEPFFCHQIVSITAIFVTCYWRTNQFNSLKWKKKGGGFQQKKYLRQPQKSLFLDLTSNWIGEVKYENLPHELSKTNPSDSHFNWSSVSSPKLVMWRTLILYYKHLLYY